MTVEATLEHPFFVFGQGWSSCQPSRTASRFGLTCHRLIVGDVCISLTHKDVTSRVAELNARRNTSSTSSTPPPLSAPPNGNDRIYSGSELVSSSTSVNAGSNATLSDRTGDRDESEASQQSGLRSGTTSPNTPTEQKRWSLTPDRQQSTSPDLDSPDPEASNITISVDDDPDDDSQNGSDSDSAAARLASSSLRNSEA